MPSPAINPHTGKPLDRDALEANGSLVDSVESNSTPMGVTGGMGQCAIWIGLALMLAGAFIPTSAGAAYNAGVISAEMLNWRMVSAIAGAGLFAGGCALYGAASLARVLIASKQS